MPTPALDLLALAALRAEDIAAFMDASRLLTRRQHALRRLVTTPEERRVHAGRAGGLCVLADALEQEALVAANETISLAVAAFEAARQAPGHDLPDDFGEICSGLNRSVSDAVRSIRDLKQARDAEAAAALYEADSRIETARLLERLRCGARSPRGGDGAP